MNEECEAMILQQIVNGITLGSIYALMAIGYAMVFSLLELINFSHGQIFMLGAYIGLYLMRLIDSSFLFVFVLAILCTGIAGIGVERLAIKPLRERNASKVAALITTLGLGIFIENTVLLVCGSDFKAFKPPFAIKYFEVLGARISSLELLIIFLSLFLMIVLNVFIFKTKHGVAIRACSQDVDTTSLMGINVSTVIASTFCVGSILAAAAGILVGFYYNFIEPSMGAIVGMKGFTASVLGGRGLISGGVLGGLVLGILESLGTTLFTAQYRDIISFGVLIAILLVKPEGILGKKRSK